ncbi:MAG: pseudaminic acid cytidylyltransferase [Flavobacteriaceae bacterium]|nr:pseudaminic acid cytidylyltransferase [Flavobacteriaceae bacterium]
MDNICVIPARGGSKRIPRKNIKEFLGKPIIAYSIQAALDSGLFDEVMVSTDDLEIADIAKNHGAKVPFMRSMKNSDDFATTFDVIEEVIQVYKSQGKEFENICCVYSCAPFVTSEILLKAYNQLIRDKFDTVFPIIAYSYPIQRALRVDQRKVFMILEENLNARSQDLEDSFHDAGQFYWCNIKQLLITKKILTQNTGGVEILELEAQDIDTELDWKLAELKYQMK